MLKAIWECTLCGWEGETGALATDEDGHKVCPICHKRGGLE